MGHQVVGPWPRRLEPAVDRVSPSGTQGRGDHRRAFARVNRPGRVDGPPRGAEAVPTAPPALLRLPPHAAVGHQFPDKLRGVVAPVKCRAAEVSGSCLWAGRGKERPCSPRSSVAARLPAASYRSRHRRDGTPGRVVERWENGPSRTHSRSSIVLARSQLRQAVEEQVREAPRRSIVEERSTIAHDQVETAIQAGCPDRQTCRHHHRR